MPANTGDNVILDLGMRVDAAGAQADMQDIVDYIRDIIKEDFNIDIRAGNLTELRQELNQLNGSLRLMKDDATGMTNAIQASFKTANGEVVRLQAAVEAMNGKYQLVGNSDVSARVTAGLGAVEKIQQQILATQEKLRQAVTDEDAAATKAASNQLRSLQQKLSVQRQVNQTLEQGADLQTAMQDRVDNTQLNQQEQAYVRLVERMTEAKATLKELEKAQEQVIQTSSMSKQSAVYQDARNSVTQLNARVEEYIQLINEAGGNASFTVQNGEVTQLTSTYNGTNRALQEMNDYINKIGQSWASARAQMSDQQKDTQKINAAVKAYRSYRDAVEVVQRAKMEGRSATQQEIATLNNAQNAYQRCERAILSNGEAVKQNATYNRDKNQVTRDSVNALKEYEAQLESTNNSMAGSIAQMIQMKLGFEGLQEAIRKVYDTAKELNDSMTNIQLVTQQSNSDATNLMKSYSGLAQELGTTTENVAASADEWLSV